LTICREVRAKSNVPIILETARIEEIDRLLGLELGADDYVCKPWSPREVVARVKAILRRADNKLEQAGSVNNDMSKGLELNEEKWAVTFDGKLLDFTRREFQLLSNLHFLMMRWFLIARLIVTSRICAKSLNLLQLTTN
jgi:two-component system response regulator BaeR